MDILWPMVAQEMNLEGALTAPAEHKITNVILTMTSSENPNYKYQAILEKLLIHRICE